MTHREAFIITCIELTRMDGELSPAEMTNCLNVLKSLGFSDSEFDHVENNLDQFTEDDLIASIKDMAPIMKKNLLKAMQEIAGSDGAVDSELDFISQIREILQ